MTFVERYDALLRRHNAQDLKKRLLAIEDEVRCPSIHMEGTTIFEEELEASQKHAEKRRQETGSDAPDLLVLVVGLSPEPLLLAIAHHTPKGIVLLEPALPQRYLDSFRHLWDAYRELLCTDSYDEVEKLKVRDNPAEVFQAVRRVVEGRRREGDPKIVIDITGAKKSMIAGAFLAAGFLDVEASYVDFEDFDQILRRPRPGSARPRSLRHPYRFFRLREESRLAEALDDGRYEEAHRLARDLQDMTGSSETRQLLSKDEANRLEAKYEAIGAVSQGYDRWSNGFFRDALEILEVRGHDTVPKTVALLGPIWPHREEHPRKILKALEQEHVFVDPAACLAYFLDVLVWNGESVLDVRPRECFLRFYGAVESVFFYAFHMCVGRCPERLVPVEPDNVAELEARCPTTKKGKPIDWDAELRSALISSCQTNSRLALRLLARESPTIVPRIDIADTVSIPRCRLRLSSPPLDAKAYDTLVTNAGGNKLYFDRFTSLRHKAVHWMAPVPAEYARQAGEYYRKVIRYLVPLSVASLRPFNEAADRSDPERIELWESLLLQSCDGQIPADCKPLAYRQLAECLVAQSTGESR